jgi:hypothetical protein
MEILWEKNGDGLADYLLGRIAVEKLRTAIPTCNIALYVSPDNCVVGGFNDCY